MAAWREEHNRSGGRATLTRLCGPPEESPARAGAASPDRRYSCAGSPSSSAGGRGRSCDCGSSTRTQIQPEVRENTIA